MYNNNFKEKVINFGKGSLSFLKEMAREHGYDAFKFLCNCFLVNKAIDKGCDVTTSFSEESIDLSITNDD